MCCLQLGLPAHGGKPACSMIVPTSTWCTTWSTTCTFDDVNAVLAGVFMAGVVMVMVTSRFGWCSHGDDITTLTFHGDDIKTFWLV